MAKIKLQHRFRKEQPGIVLLLALILMATIMASTIAISVTITRTLTQSRNLDNFIIASIASDSGIERGLAAIKVGRTTGKTFSASVTASDTTSTTTLANSGATYDVDGTESVDDYSLNALAEDETATFDILQTTAAPASYLVITAQCPGVGCSSLLEVTWVLIANTGSASLSNRLVLSNGFTYPYSGNGTSIHLATVRSDTSNQPDTFPSGDVLGYRVRLRAVDGDLENVRAVPCNVTSIPCPSPEPLRGRVILDSTGEAGPSNGRAQSRKQAAVFWQPQAAGLLNYVLFSEESIIP